MRFSVVICTYEAPRELDFALCALSRQSVAPHEVLVADDGSGAGTREVIERWADRLGCTVIHAWQSDRGYRKARIVNEAVRRSSGDRLLFLDGDSFPHPRWVEDHVGLPGEDTVGCGRRVKLGPEISRVITVEDIEQGRFDRITARLLGSAMRRDTRRLGLGVRLPRAITRLLHPRSRKLMGVNYSVSRAAFFAVNGLDEAWTFYGREDLDLEGRLRRAGYRLYPLINRGIVYHVYHPERERSEEALRLVALQAAATQVRCERGIESEVAFDPAT